MSELTNLIIVPGHAVPCVKTRDETCNPLAWLGTYAGYRYGEEILQYLRHIQRGVDLAVRDPTSLLVFSGGRTRQGTSTSEASGYRSVAELWDWWGHGKCVSHRADLEEFATDSFENLLFSILLFEHRTGMFPSLVTVVGLRFKQRRFVTHAKAIISARYCHVPAFFFTYDDINDLPDYLLDEGSRDGELATLKAFRDCPFGDNGTLLEKRHRRDPHGTYNSRPAYLPRNAWSAA